MTLNMLIAGLDFGEMMFESFFCLFFQLFSKFRILFDFIQGQILLFTSQEGMVGPIDLKRKGGASVGYWMNCVTLIFDLIHDIDNFEIAVFQEVLVWLMWKEKWLWWGG